MKSCVVHLINSADHPSFDIVESHGTGLSGKKIVLCVAGSVAAYKAIELARLFMRHGADVTCVASGAATKLIKPDYLKWATGNDVITKLTGKLEHIRLADYNKSDLIVVYPATANTLGKLANGIDDTPVSTVLTVGFGSGIPVVMCLAMHASMYENVAVKRNMDFLSKKVEFVEPQTTEGKAKAAEPEDVLAHILGRFGHSQILAGKRVLIAAGPTVEPIDAVRAITNQSTGRTGVLLASEMVSSGACVTMVYGPGCEKVPPGVRCIRVGSAFEMQRAIKKEMKKRLDVVVMAAAVSDYTVRNPKKTKMESNKAVSLSLVPAPKIIDGIKKTQPDALLVGFKAEAGISKKELGARAKRKMLKVRADVMVANDVGSARYKKNPRSNEVLILGPRGARWSGWKKKEKIAKLVRCEIEACLR